MSAFEWLEHAFPNLDHHEKDLLLYLSLFDPTSWEEEVLFDFNEIEIRNKITHFLKNSVITFNETDEDRIKDFIRSYFYSGKITNHVIRLFLKESNIESETESKSTESIDLLIDKDGQNVFIEIKRLSSTTNLRGEIEGYISKIKNKNLSDHKHFFIILTPLSEKDDYYRYRKILWGYGHLINYKISNECSASTSSCAIPVMEKCSEKESALNILGNVLKNHLNSK